VMKTLTRSLWSGNLGTERDASAFVYAPSCSPETVLDKRITDRRKSGFAQGAEP